MGHHLCDLSEFIGPEERGLGCGGGGRDSEEGQHCLAWELVQRWTWWESRVNSSDRNGKGLLWMEMWMALEAQGTIHIDQEDPSEFTSQAPPPSLFRAFSN